VLRARFNNKIKRSTKRFENNIYVLHEKEIDPIFTATSTLIIDCALFVFRFYCLYNIRIVLFS